MQSDLCKGTVEKMPTQAPRAARNNIRYVRAELAASDDPVVQVSTFKIIGEERSTIR